MIQRPQSIYLLLASLAIFALFLLPLAHNLYIGNMLTTIKVDGMYRVDGTTLTRYTSFLALTIMCIVMALVPLIIIFRYKNRKQQIAFCYGFMLALIGYSFWLSQTVKQVTMGINFRTDNYGIGILMPTTAIVFMLFAIKGIRNDEKLIKSADRLR